MDFDAFPIEEFCKRNGISRPFFYKLQKEGRGPRIMKVGRRTLVSAEAAADWRQKMEAETETARSA